MPVQKGKSSLVSKLGNRLQKAHEEHKNDETVLSNFGDLPAGIDNGIAQLVECKFDVYKSGDFVGEYYFYAAGVVVYPKEHEGFPIEGLRTSIGPEPLCDTPKRQARPTLDHHLQWIYNELRKLGIDTTTMEFDDLESTVAALKEAQPTFRFRTWKGEATQQYPNPKTNHSWNGICEFNPGDSNAVVDDTPSAKAAPKTPNGASSKTPAKPTGKLGKKPEPEQTKEVFDEFAQDLETLVADAENGDLPARAKLQELALNAGASQEDIDDAADWQAVADLAQGGQTEVGPETEASDDFEPEVGNVYGYKPMDPKTKKPTSKPVQCEVQKVDKKKRTADLLNLDNGKTKYPGVSWDNLIVEE